MIDGLDLPFALELPAIRAGLANWPSGKTASERKVELFDDRVIGIALERLGQLGARPGASDSAEPNSAV